MQIVEGLVAADCSINRVCSRYHTCAVHIHRESGRSTIAIHTGSNVLALSLDPSHIGAADLDDTEVIVASLLVVQRLIAGLSAFTVSLAVGIVTVHVPVQNGAYLMTSNDVDMGDLARSVLIADHTVACTNFCSNTFELTKAGNVIDLTICRHNAVGSSTGSVGGRQHNAIYAVNEVVGSEGVVTGNTNCIVNLQNDTVFHLQAEDRHAHSIQIINDLKVTGTVSNLTAIHSQLNVVPAVSVGGTLRSVQTGREVTADIVVQRAVHHTVDNEDNLRITHGICNDEHTVIHLQLGFLALHLRSGVDIVDLGVGADNALIGLAQLSTERNAGSGKALTVLAQFGNIVVVSQVLATGSIGTAEAVHHIALFIEFQAAASCIEGITIQCIDNILQISADSYNFTVCSHLDVEKAILCAFTGRHFQGCVVHTLVHTPVDLGISHTGNNEHIRRSIFIAAVNQNLVQIQHGVLLTNNLCPIRHIHNGCVVIEGVLLLHTVQGNSRVSQKLIAVYILHISLIRNLHSNLVGLIDIDSNTVVIQFQAHQIHTVDSVHQFLIGDRNLLKLATNNELHIVKSVLRGFTVGHVSLRVQHGFNIPIECRYRYLFLRCRLFCFVVSEKQQNTCGNSCNDQDANDNPQPQQTLFASSFFLHSSYPLSKKIVSGIIHCTF